MDVTEFRMVFKDEIPYLCDLHEDFIEGVKRVKVHKKFILVKLEQPMTYEEVEDLFDELNMQYEMQTTLRYG